MNERIRELADEAAKFSAIMALPTGESGDKLFVEKFALLIVLECSSILRKEAESNWEGREERLLNAMANWIENHFGVEE